MKIMNKKCIVSLMILMVALLPFTMAADEDTMTVTATTNYYDITLYQDDGSTPYTTWTVGSVDPSTETIMPNASCIAVKNTGNCNCDYQVKLTEPANWTAADDVVGADIYMLMLIFNANNTATAEAADFTEAEDHINTDYITAAAAVYAGDSDGASVAANAIVYGYMSFLAPSSQTAAHPSQTITVTFKATSPA